MEKLLILDIDETLLHASEQCFAHAPDFGFGAYHVYLRPHAREFIAHCAAHYRLAVWTSSGSRYAQAVADELFTGHALEFVWSRSRCTPKFDPENYETIWSKNLDKVRRQGYALEHVLMVDDSPEKLRRHYGNLVRVRPFEGNAQDDELKHLMAYLTTLSGVPNVRAVEKRDWRIRLLNSRQSIGPG